MDKPKRGLKQYLEHFDIIYMKLIIILLIQKGGKPEKKKKEKCNYLKGNFLE